MSTQEDMRQTIESAAEDLRDWEKDNPGEEPHDTIHEIADQAVPVYTSDIMDWASEDVNLAVSEPELGPAFDGSPTPVNIIAANIYEWITGELWEEWRKIETEREEAEAEED